MTDVSLTIAAMLVELGLPGALLWAYVRLPRFRKRAVVVLGALVPFLAGYLYLALSQLFSSAQDSGWAFGAVWIMTFAMYMAALLLGTAMSLIPSPEHLFGRFMIGLATLPILVGFIYFL